MHLLTIKGAYTGYTALGSLFSVTLEPLADSTTALIGALGLSLGHSRDRSR